MFVYGMGLFASLEQLYLDTFVDVTVRLRNL